MQGLDADSIVPNGSNMFLLATLVDGGDGFKRLWLARLVITVPVCPEEKLKGGQAISITRAEMYGKYTL